LSQLFWVNVSLAVFNLLPAFPMDGGRVLRALLAMRFGYVRATQVAARVGQGMALLFGFVGLFGNPFLVFIALFVWLGAAQEASLVQMRSALDGIPVMHVMITDFRSLHPNDSLARAVEHVVSGFQQDFPVVEGDRLEGILMRNDLTAALGRFGLEGRVGDIMRRDFVSAEPTEMLQTVLARLQECGCHTLPVEQAGRLLGLVTSDNLAEVLMIQEALRNAHRPSLRQAPSNSRERNRLAPSLAESSLSNGFPKADVTAGEGTNRN
jgi:CBS domain-containing protein